MRRLPTVTDVAAAAGVSRQTVSNVLNAPEIVRPETRERVQRVIARLGYRPHASARRLRTRVSSTIGVRLDPGTDGVSGALLDRFLHALVESWKGPYLDRERYFGDPDHVRLPLDAMLAPDRILARASAFQRAVSSTTVDSTCFVPAMSITCDQSRTRRSPRGEATWNSSSRIHPCACRLARSSGSRCGSTTMPRSTDRVEYASACEMPNSVQ